MAEIFRDSVNVGVEFSVSSATIENAVINRKGTLTNTAHAIVGGKAIIAVPYEITRYDGKFDIVVTYDIGGKEYTKIDVHEIITPLFTPAELREHDSDFSALTDKEAINLETIIRTVFETLTGQSYGLERDTVTFPGSGSRQVGLPKRAVSVEPYEDSNSIQSLGWTNITNDGWILSVSPRSSWMDKFDNDEYEKRNRVPFKNGYKYRLTGLWGYHSVPEDIKTAALTLASDWGCDQSEWSNRYIKSMRQGNWRIEFGSMASTFTGNARVDKILDKYRVNRLTVI